MFRLIAFPHPFTNERSVSEHEHGILVAEAVRLARHDAHPGVVPVVSVNDATAKPLDLVQDGDIVTVRFVPAGDSFGAGAIASGANMVASGKNQFRQGAWIPGLIQIVGGSYLQQFGKLVQPLDFMFTSTKREGGKYSIRGGQNQSNGWGKIPVILGKTRISPYYAGTPYTEYSGIDGKDAFIRMLFVAGYGPLDITDIKIGDNLIASNSAKQRDGTIAIDGRYPNAQIEIRNGTSCTLYEKTVIEDQIGIQLKRYSNTASVDVDASSGSILITGKRWDDDYHAEVGDTITTSGFVGASNNGDFEITDMSEDGTRIYVDSSTLANEIGSGSFSIYQTYVHAVPKGTDSVDIVASFPSGLGTYSAANVLTIAKSVTIEARYREKDTGTAFNSCTLAGYFDGATNAIERMKLGFLRFTVSVTGLDATKEYEIIMRRLTDNSDESADLDDCEFVCVRRYTASDAIDSTIRSKLCYFALRIKASAGIQGTIGKINCLAEADYARTGATGNEATLRAMARNPAGAYVSVLMGNANPRPRTTTQIDWAPLLEWATWCDTAGYECNGAVTSAGKLYDVLARIAACGRATPADRNGLSSIVADIERTNIMQYITPRNSWGFQGNIAYPEKIHGLKVAFINEENDFEQDERIVLDDGYKYDTESDGTLRDWLGDEVSTGYTLATKFEKIEIPYTTSPEQIMKTGRYLLAVRRLRPMSMTVNLDPEHMVCTRGDRIRVAHDSVSWGLGWARITGIVAASNLFPSPTLYPDPDLFPGGDVSEIYVDDTFAMESGKTYQIIVRLRDGTTATRTVTGSVGDNTHLILSTVIPVSDDTRLGNLVVFGETNLVTTDCIITAIDHNEDSSARLSLVEYAPDVFDADSGTIPAYNPRLTARSGTAGLIAEVLVRKEVPSVAKSKGAVDSKISNETINLYATYVASPMETETFTVPQGSFMLQIWEASLFRFASHMISVTATPDPAVFVLSHELLQSTGAGDLCSFSGCDVTIGTGATDDSIAKLMRMGA